MRKIKLYLFIFTLFFLVLGSDFTVNAEVVEIDNVKWGYKENEDGTISITSYGGKNETVIVPSEINGKKVTSIGGFYMSLPSALENIKHIVIPEGITEIRRRAFGYCANLQRVDIPNTVQTIDDYAFSDCVNLEFVSLPEGITVLSEGLFYNCGNKLENITIPSTVQVIEDNVFYSCRKIKNISLPDSITDIGENAFWWCDSLIKIKVPKNVEIIKKNCFGKCSNLQEVDIKEGVTRIEDMAFAACSSLKKVVLPSSITYIGKNVFITSSGSTLPNLIIHADPYSYAKTYADQQGIKFSCADKHLNIVTDNAVKPICTASGKTEGKHCEACGTIIVEQKTIAPTGHKWNSGTITTEPTAVSDGIRTYTCTACGTKKNETIPKSDLPQKGKAITIPNSKDTYKVTKSATQNGTVEFEKVDKTKSSITIPATITVDGITYKVTSISKNAFKNNKNLKKVTIGKNITTIGTNAFYGCKNLKTITIKSTQLKSISKNAFKGINAKAKIKVPKSKLTKYKKLLKGKGQKSTVKITK